MNLKVTGYREIGEELGHMQKAVREEGVKQAVRAAAAVIRDEMALQTRILEEHTAKRTALDPGALKRSMRRIGLGSCDAHRDPVAWCDPRLGPQEGISDDISKLLRK